MADGGASQRRPPLALMPREGARPGGRGVGVGAQAARVEQAGGSRSPQPKRGAASGARRAGNGPLRLLLEGRVLRHLWAVGGGTPLDFLPGLGLWGRWTGLGLRTLGVGLNPTSPLIRGWLGAFLTFFVSPFANWARLAEHLGISLPRGSEHWCNICYEPGAILALSTYQAHLRLPTLTGAPFSSLVCRCGN